MKKIFNHEKSWTILNYANGNNELEPEICNSVSKIKDAIISDNIKVITQLGRAPQSLVKLLRNNIPVNAMKSWNGVKRYKTTLEGIKLVEDLENKNMADPNTLYEFITWGIANYPSDNIMLILSGHGAGFAGVMTDLSNDHPYIMPMNGLCNAIYNSKKKTKKSIDCVLLDSCYMNMIEVWYEFALIPNKPVKYLIAPSKNIPLEGLQYQLIIKYLQDKSISKEKVINILENTVKHYNIEDKINDLFVVKLNRKSFIKLKNSIDNLAYEYINKESNDINNIRKEIKEPTVNVLYLESIFNKDEPIYEIKEDFERIIPYTEIDKYIEKIDQGPSVYLPFTQEQYEPLKEYYHNMMFLDKNRWLNIVENKHTLDYYKFQEKNKSYNKMPSPIPVPIENVISVMLDQNPQLSVEEAYKIIYGLGW